MQLFSFFKQYAEFYNIPLESLIGKQKSDEQLLQLAFDLGFDFGCQ